MIGGAGLSMRQLSLCLTVRWYKLFLWAGNDLIQEQIVSIERCKTTFREGTISQVIDVDKSDIRVTSPV